MEMRKIKVNGIDAVVFENGEVFVKPPAYEAGGGTDIGNGYIYAKVNRRHAAIHRVVAEAFHGAPLNGQEVNHIDGDKKNNWPKNLEWVTHAENMAHAARNKLGGLHGQWNDSENGQPAKIRGRAIDPMAWVKFAGGNACPEQKNKPSPFRNMLWAQVQEYFGVDNGLVETASLEA